MTMQGSKLTVAPRYYTMDNCLQESIQSKTKLPYDAVKQLALFLTWDVSNETCKAKQVPSPEGMHYKGYH